MKEKISVLIQLQDCDDRIREIVNKKDEGPLRIKKLEDELNFIESKFQEENDKLQFLKKDRRNIEQEIQDLEGKVEKSEDINPFMALFGLFKGGEKVKKGEKKKIESVKDIKKDNFVEQTVRADAASTAGATLYTIYDIYKKAHGMASAPGKGFERTEEGISKESRVKLKDVFKGREGN